jgi:hypothetical protein
MVKVKQDMSGWIMSEHGVPDSRWTVIEQVEDYISPKGEHHANWLCECSCQDKTRKIIRECLLKNGNSKSCGCLKRELQTSEANHLRLMQQNQKFKNTTGRVRPRHNIIGKKFGMLTVVEQIDDFIHPGGQRFAQYRCRCDCGEFVNVVGNDLTRKEAADHKPKTHCGCQSSKNRSEAQRKQNLYEFDGDVVIGTTYNTGDKFLFDADDFDSVKDYCWFVHEDATGYKSLVAKIPGTDKHIKMTKLLGYQYHDHINRNALDNRKSNLRPATDSENMRNRSLFSNNTSGVTGVWQRSDNQRWHAEVKINKRAIFLGDFVNKEDAIKARLQAEADYYGEFAPQQYLFEQYNIKNTTE